MVIGDDADLCDGITYVPEARGYAVIAAEDDEDALAKLHDGPWPGLILLDALVPREDGFQFRTEQRRLIRIAERVGVPCLTIQR